MAFFRHPRQPAALRVIRPLLRRMDQVAVASLVLLALLAMGAYWLVQGGVRGALIEIDRVEPRIARFQVDINQAAWAELAQLPRIGEILARRIITSRVAEGPFVDHEDLRRVSGIGPRTLTKMRPYLLPMPDQREVAISQQVPTHPAGAL